MCQRDICRLKVALPRFERLDSELFASCCPAPADLTLCEEHFFLHSLACSSYAILVELVAKCSDADA